VVFAEDTDFLVLLERADIYWLPQKKTYKRWESWLLNAVK